MCFARALARTRLLDVNIAGANAALVVGRRRHAILRRRRSGNLLLSTLLMLLKALNRIGIATRLTSWRGVAAHACAHVVRVRENVADAVALFTNKNLAGDKIFV
jgi:hypothetical protein